MNMNHFKIRKSFLLVFLVFNPVHFDLIINELVDVGDHSGALDIHQDEAWDDLCLETTVSSSSRARVDIELVLVFIRLKLVCVSCDHDVTVQLPANIIVQSYESTQQNNLLFNNYFAKKNNFETNKSDKSK